MTRMKFDKNRCVELLKEIRSLQKEGKWFIDYDKAKNDELNNYLTLIENKVFWENGKKYIQLLDLFVTKRMTLDQFSTKFCYLWSSNLNSSDIWIEKLEEEDSLKSTEINIQINPKSYGFSEIISDLHSLIDLYNPDVTLEMNLKEPELLGYGISEEYLRLTIEEDFLPQLKAFFH